MFNFLIAYDNNDMELGNYLDACFSNLKQYIDSIDDKNLYVINSDQCTQEQVKESIGKFSGSKFIFIGYTHGNADALVVSHKSYISFSNAEKFRNSFFYTCACSSAVNLGPELKRKGCLSYIGYNDVVKMPLAFIDVFIKCKNSGMAFFLQGGKTVGESYRYMLRTYDGEIERLSARSSDSFLAAALLQSNRNAITILGDEDLTMSNFEL